MRLRMIVATAALALIAMPALAAAQAPGQRAAQPDQKPRAWPMEQIQGFHVVLVVGEAERGRSSVENLTEAAARALKDMGEFLPYKSYRVLDAQWTSCCSGPQSTISGRLQGVIGVPGPNGTLNLVHRPYVFRITARSSSAGIQTRFALAALEGRSAHSTDHRAELERSLKNAREDYSTMELRVQEARKRVDVGVASALELREMEDKLTQRRREVEALQADIERTTAPGESGVIDSSFTMNAGETVVVGTSKLGGDKALIAIVTAARKGRE